MRKLKIIPEDGIALVTVLVTIFILTILAGTILSFLANQVKSVEHHNTRTKAMNSIEAAFVERYAMLINNGTILNESINVNGIPMNVYYDDSGSGLNGSNILTIVADYGN